MDITLVSHASVVVGTSDTAIWSDPWLFGTAFNDSWRLHPPAQWDPSRLASIEYLWLSHEHPDHFHVATLRSLPDEFKQRVVVLFQENNSEKMFDALRRFGFAKFRKLPHGRLVDLTPATKVYCYQVGQMDSALAIENCGHTILNLNDCEVNSGDLQRIKRTIKRCDVLLNQFSVAGSPGYVDGDTRLANAAKRVLANMVQNHVDIGAGTTIPIASFMYFAADDNKYMNKHANTVPMVMRTFADNGLRCAALYPGDTLTVAEPYDSASALSRFDVAHGEVANLSFTSAASVPFEALVRQYYQLAKRIHDHYPMLLLRSLKPVTIRVRDLGTVVRFSIPAGTIEAVSSGEPDLEIHSQPLSFAFSNTFGFQTLGVSARYTLFKNASNWRKHRILFSLHNAELYLRPHLFFRRQNLAWLGKRLPGATNQLVYQLKRMS